MFVYSFQTVFHQYKSSSLLLRIAQSRFKNNSTNINSTLRTILNIHKSSNFCPFPIRTLVAQQIALKHNIPSVKESIKNERLNRIYTIPNLLCAFRIGITPVIGYQIVDDQFGWAICLCFLSSITDFLDGWIARKYNLESKLGSVLDPLADKLLIATLTFTLAYVHLIPYWLVGLILLRDTLIITGGLWLRYKSLPSPIKMSRFFDMNTFKSERFAPTFISKFNTGFQLSLVLVTLSYPLLTAYFDHYYLLLPSLQIATGFTTLWSGLNYLSRLKPKKYS